MEDEDLKDIYFLLPTYIIVLGDLGVFSERCHMTIPSEIFCYNVQHIRPSTKHITGKKVYLIKVLCITASST